MPRNQFQRMVFAFITVVITVHAYVFYSVYVVNGNFLIQQTGASSVLEAVDAQGGILMFGRMLPIWAVVLVEFAFAYTLEVLLGSPLSFRLACRKFDPRKNHPMIFESAIITATVCIMCPAMSLIATFLYFPYGHEPLNLVTVAAKWLRLVCFNLPFAYFSQMFFIQPFVRFTFRTLFARDIASRTEERAQGKKPSSEVEAIQDVIIRENEIKKEEREERS